MIEHVFEFDAVAFRDDQLAQLLSLRFLLAIAENPPRRLFQTATVPKLSVMMMASLAEALTTRRSHLPACEPQIPPASYTLRRR
jgi:hypothetical protein